MTQKQIFQCEKCGIPLTKKLLREMEGHIFCYYCARRYDKKFNAKAGGKSNDRKNL